LPSILISYNYDEVSRDPFPHNDDKIRQVILNFSGQADNSRRANPSFDYKIKLEPIPTDSIFVCQHTPAEWFQHYFQYMEPAEILKNHSLYRFAGFRVFIKTLPDYKKYIQKIQKKLLNRSGFVHCLAKIFVRNSPSNA